MLSRYLIFQTSLGLALAVASAIACNPTHQRPQRDRQLGGNGLPGPAGNTTNNKPDGSYQTTCTDNLRIDPLASEKEFTSLSEALNGRADSFTLSDVMIFETLTGPASAANSTLYLSAQLASSTKGSGSAQPGLQITCHNTRAGNGKSQGSALDAHLTLPNELNAKDGSIPNVINLDAYAEQGQSRAQAKRAASKANQTIKDYDTAMTSPDKNMERKVVYVVDNDGHIHLRAQEKYTLGDGSVAIKKYEAIFTASSGR